MADLSLNIRYEDRIAVVEPIGYLNAHTARQFEETLQDLIDKRQLNIVINCRALEYIASAGQLTPASPPHRAGRGCRMAAIA